MFPKGITLNLIFSCFTSHYLFSPAPHGFWKSKKSRDLSGKQEHVIEISHINGHHAGLPHLTINEDYLVFSQLPRAPEKG